MIEITAEIRAFIDKAAAGVELAEDEYIDNASRNCSNGAPKREGHHGSCGGKDAHHYYGKEQNRKNAQCNIVLCLHFVGHADSFCLFTHIDHLR